MDTIEDESAAATEARGPEPSGGAAEQDTAEEEGSSNDSRPAKRQRVEEEEEEEEQEQEEEGACGGHVETRPAPSRWCLRADACTKVKEQPGDCTEAAGRWLFEEAREGGELTDMEFVLDSGRRVRGHKTWLSARCEYIRGMLCCGMREGQTGVVRVRDCCEGAFVALLEFIYTGRLGDTCLGQEWHELWALADLFGMEGMVESLLSAVTRDNVEEAARVALERGMRPLMERCVSALPSRPASGDEARRVIRTVDLLGFCGDDHVNDDIGDGWCACHAYNEWMLVMKAGGIDAVVGAMRKDRQDAFIQERGCVALFALFYMMYPESLALMKTREALMAVFKAVVEALRDHPANAQVQWAGCLALGEIAACGRKFWKNASAVIGNARGVDTVMGALKAHGANAKVQRAGLQTLFRLSIYNDSDQRHAVASGGFEVAMAALENHGADAGVSKWGCAVLRGLDCVGAAGAVEAIVRTLNDHDDYAVQEQGCMALLQLVESGNYEGVHRICAAGGMKAIMEAVKTHHAYSVLGTTVNEILFSICFHHDDDNDEGKRRARDAMGIEAVLESLKISNNGAQEVVEAAQQVVEYFRFFDCLDEGRTWSKEGRTWYFGHVDANRYFYDYQHGISSPCRCFECYNSHFHRHFDDEAWRVDIAVFFMNGCIGSSPIQALGCQVLFDLFDDYDNVGHAERLGAISALEAAIRRHPGHQDLQMHGRNALRRWGEYACPSVLEHYRSQSLPK